MKAASGCASEIDPMSIEKDKVVSFHYVLKDESGTEQESSRDGEPMHFLCGANNIVPGLERAMLGKDVGDSLSVTVEPVDGYGLRNENLSMRVSAKRLGVVPSKLKPGAVLQLQTRQGPVMARVVKVGRFMIDLDANHPMAGRTLNFEVEITDIRDATKEELAHGHVHSESSSCGSKED